MYESPPGGSSQLPFQGDKVKGKADVKASKAFSWLLRHGAEKEGLVVYPGGWVILDDILRKPNFKKFTIDQVKELVDNCPKQRFALKEEEGVLYIRATQGHSIEVDDSDLEEITFESQFPVVVHGTYYRHWDQIKQQGLSRMHRRHIHFSPGLPGDDGVISGMRSSCQIYIYIDLAKALAAGFRFFKSSNNVILCPGDETGHLPPQYFAKVEDKKTGVGLL